MDTRRRPEESTMNPLKLLLVVANVKNWPLNIPNVEIVSAKKYITEPVFSRMTGVRVFNVARVYRYQEIG